MQPENVQPLLKQAQHVTGCRELSSIPLLYPSMLACNAEVNG